ncbi:TPA: hypothetical protein ACH6KR_002505, partial [Enterococcus faecium]
SLKEKRSASIAFFINLYCPPLAKKAPDSFEQPIKFEKNFFRPRSRKKFLSADIFLSEYFVACECPMMILKPYLDAIGEIKKAMLG